MKGTSKVIMGATLVMAASLALVLGLILVLLAELYCSLLLRRRRQLRRPISNQVEATQVSVTPNSNSCNALQGYHQSNTSPLSNFYTQGVLDAPRSLLFPAVVSGDNDAVQTKKQLQQRQLSVVPCQVIHLHSQETNSTPHQIGLLPASSSALVPVNASQHTRAEDSFLSGSQGSYYEKTHANAEHLVYISNPIYDNEASEHNQVNTPFETPDTSPSRLEPNGSLGGEETVQQSPSSPESLPLTPPLTPMKKLPAEACSVSLRDVGSLCTTCSESNSNNRLSSSSSGTPCTSPSW